MKYFLFLFLLFYSCDKIERRHILSHNKIVLIDSTIGKGRYLDFQKGKNYAYYPIYYFGQKSDTIYLGKKPVPAYEYYVKEKYDPYSYPKPNDMSIIIDTTFSLCHKENYWHWSEKYNRELIDSTVLYNAFPIFVNNVSDSFLFLGIFNNLGNTVRQAKNDKGEWIDIESKIFYDCGTGARDIIIPPKQMLVAKLLRLKGDFYTECRLKYSRSNQSIFSNVYHDYIKKNMLTNKLPSPYELNHY